MVITHLHVAGTIHRFEKSVHRKEIAIFVFDFDAECEATNRTAPTLNGTMDIPFCPFFAVIRYHPAVQQSPLYCLTKTVFYKYILIGKRKKNHKYDRSPFFFFTDLT